MIVYRYKSPKEWYLFHTYGAGIAVQKLINEYSRLDWLNYPFEANKTYHYDIDFIGDKVTLYINDVKIGEIADTPPTLEGATIALSAFVGADPDSEVWFDNIKVTRIDSAIDLPVPYFNQNALPWGPSEYDSTNSLGVFGGNASMDRWGCAVTSIAMILNFNHITQFADGTPINPGTLNDWLKTAYDPDPKHPLRGYSSGFGSNGWYSYINWPIIGYLTENLVKAGKAPYDLEYDASSQNKDQILDGIVNGNSLAKIPSILHVKNSQTLGHYVVAKGQTADKILTINDPEWNYPDLTSFNNTYDEVRRYIPSHSDLSYINAVVNPDIEILLTDAQGRRTGKLVTEGKVQEYHEIPDAIYDFEPPLSNPNSAGTAEELGTGVNELLFKKPDTGEYTLTLSSSKNSYYTTNIAAYNSEGVPTLEKYMGILSQESSHNYLLSYDKITNSSIHNEITYQSTLQDINSAEKQGLIQHGLAQSLSSEIKNDEENESKNKNAATQHLENGLNDLEKNQNNEKNISPTAYEILHYDFTTLHDALQ
ncbi:MAG: C39 family peptidase [Candidatus Levyibacteriota bacterium]